MSPCGGLILILILILEFSRNHTRIIMKSNTQTLATSNWPLLLLLQTEKLTLDFYQISRLENAINSV